MALPLRLALSLYLRRRQGALVFTATRLSGHSARRVHDGTFQAGIQNREVVCSDVHDPMRASGWHPRQLARPADVAGGSAEAGEAERSGKSRADSTTAMIDLKRLIDELNPRSLRRFCTTILNSTIPGPTIFRP